MCQQHDNLEGYFHTLDSYSPLLSWHFHLKDRSSSQAESFSNLNSHSPNSCQSHNSCLLPFLDIATPFKKSQTTKLSLSFLPPFYMQASGSITVSLCYLSGLITSLAPFHLSHHRPFYEALLLPPDCPCHHPCLYSPASHHRLTIPSEDHVIFVVFPSACYTC